MPLFSIIIPLYNKENHIGKTLSSILDQHQTNYEIIIVNDGSTDSSEDIVLGFNDQRIKYYSSTINQGVSKTRNYGIEKSKGKLIVFLDADDCWYPNHLEVLFQLYQKFPNAGLYATSYEKNFNSKSNFIANFKNIDARSNSFSLVENFFESSTIDSIAWTSACAVPKNIFNSIGNFDTAITHGEDIDLWIRIALKHKVALATFITAIYNINASNGSKQVNIKQKLFLKFEKFKKDEQNNIYLKQYLDLNRYSIALQYKMAGDNITAKNYYQDIDRKNLTWKHQLLIKLPRVLLIILKNTQIFIINFLRVDLSTFK